MEVAGSPIRYGTLNRYWFLQLARWISKAEQAKQMWDEVFFCPDDKYYSAEAERMRIEGGSIHRISYLMSDAAFWSPYMFSTKDTLQGILSENQLYNDCNSCGDPGPSEITTYGRKYQFMSQVKFPETKVYIWEVNAFLEEPKHGYNELGLSSTSLFFDGHASKTVASKIEKEIINGDRSDDDRLYWELMCRMGWTDVQLDTNDPLYWYYGATKMGIWGRDFYEVQ